MLSKLIQSVGKIYNAVVNHIGKGEDAHPVASWHSNGFMSTDDKGVIDTRGMRVITVSDGSDINKLEFGRFIARSFVNAPSEVTDSSVCIVSISGNGSGFKEIFFTRLTDGARWCRTIYNNDTDTGYQRDVRLLKVDANYVNMTLRSGVTGVAVCRQLTLDSGIKMVEIIFDVTSSTPITGVTELAVLPSGYYSSNAPAPIYNVTRGSSSVDKNTFICTILHKTNVLSALNVTGATDIIKASGQFTIFV